MKRLLRVETDYFVAGAVFHGPYCVQTAPILHWMKGKPSGQIHAALLKMGAHWDWLPDPGTNPGLVSSSKQLNG